MGRNPHFGTPKKVKKVRHTNPMGSNYPIEYVGDNNNHVKTFTPHCPFTHYGHLVKHDNGDEYFNHIYSSDFGTRFCNDAADIYEITFELHENQEKDIENVEYWGWVDDSGEVSMIFAAYFLFNMCFTYGVKGSEDAGQGKAFKFKIININKL